MDKGKSRSMRYFLAVAREKSISGATEALHLSQPTLSRQLKDLEDELGTILFERGARQISLTDDGMIFRKRAEEIYAILLKRRNRILSATIILLAKSLLVQAKHIFLRILQRQ